ncbi:MAG TPA: riboflavin synthase [Gemmatimonadota bacterium]|nr:riboflavin synthase [Gemmatimonadota bacterium]
MFTGIVETVGEIREVRPLGEGRRLTVAAPWAESLAIGDSVAIDGCCLTVVERDATMFVVEAVRETLARTVTGDYAPGRAVNLERALAVGDRLGGHFVQGHVDQVATVRSIERSGENRYIELDLPPDGRELAAARGSIAVDGVSLTILAATPDGVRLSIIPHTWERTTLGRRAVGDRVNVEYDLIARYIKGIMELES